MEVVGTVAATAQLVGLAMSLLDSIAQLQDIIKHVPGRYQRWSVELDLLGETITRIQHNAGIQSCQVGRVLEAMYPKIESLMRLCKKYTPRSEASLIIKILKTLSAHAVEPRIVEHLQSLEHYKTTLLLAIQLIPAKQSSIEDSPSPDEIMSNRNFNNHHKSHAKDPPQISTEDMNSDRFFSAAEPINVATQVCRSPGKQMTLSPNLRLVASRETVYAEEPNPAGHCAQQPNTMYGTMGGNFTKIKVTGDSSLVGSSRAPGGNFDDITINGNRSMIGDHSADVYKSYFAVEKQQSYGHHSYHNGDVYGTQGRAAGVNVSDPAFRGGGRERDTKGESDKMVLDEQDADEAEDRMDVDPR
ncbi:hypothetical protein GGR55DRAFT_633458 [Xylaria sp. FL0064]|nr:hypothetical protein GGR55DRAFT_633458 [Xylaria sp. FL0064]